MNKNSHEYIVGLEFLGARYEKRRENLGGYQLPSP